ncbi:MAG: phosphotransferase [Pseudomonadota bacterium]|nr:phosphotransferase [Pseudomonadota bacterium]
MIKITSKKLSSFLAKADVLSKDLIPIKNDASKRYYYRIKKKNTNLLVMDSSQEKKSLKNFIFLSKWLINKGYSAPTVLSANLSKGCCITEDFGNQKFSNLTKKNLSKKYEVAIKLLSVISKEAPPSNLNNFTKLIFFKELSLFINWYLYRNKNSSHSSLLLWKNIWNELFDKLSSYKHESIILRDFHVDNLFWLKERNGIKKIGLIDFQDALIGHPCYDLVSLLQDVRVFISYKEQMKLLDYYISINQLNERLFREHYIIFGTQRLIKIIGIFYRLKYKYNKNIYMKYLPRTWQLLKKNLQNNSLKNLSKWFNKYVFK